MAFKILVKTPSVIGPCLYKQKLVANTIVVPKNTKNVKPKASGKQLCCPMQGNMEIYGITIEPNTPLIFINQ